MAGALEGIKIVELAIWAAGPAGGGIMADWGAEVIKVEEPEGGDPFRAFLSTGVGEVLLAAGVLVGGDGEVARTRCDSVGELGAGC